MVDAAALLLATIGFHMAFRQRLVRRWCRALRGRPASTEICPREEDPTGYALLIFGMMLFAFALISGGFVTAFAVFS